MVIVPEVFDPNEKAEREIVDLAAAVCGVWGSRRC